MELVGASKTDEALQLLEGDLLEIASLLDNPEQAIADKSSEEEVLRAFVKSA